MTECRFTGKTALISGGASGIGLATARRLIADGATVWISDIQDELGESVAEEIGATYVHLDVVSESEWISAVELVASQGQGLHLVMNNRRHRLQWKLGDRDHRGASCGQSTSICLACSWGAKSARL